MSKMTNIKLVSISIKHKRFSQFNLVRKHFRNFYLCGWHWKNSLNNNLELFDLIFKYKRKCRDIKTHKPRLSTSFTKYIAINLRWGQDKLPIILSNPFLYTSTNRREFLAFDFVWSKQNRIFVHLAFILKFYLIIY